MDREDVKSWFDNVAKPAIEANHGMFGTFYYVYEDEYDRYRYSIGYQGYSCGVVTEDGCNDCPYRTEHGDCGEYHLYINEDGSIYFEGSEKTYREEEFEELLNWFS